ncbi:ras-associating domain containing protein [Holotrichia oblita]|uniref:Ras-associating domain containing protein n=1 Tax=Holotrichia oblita TaxID=644536 RepID=A0ACB9T7M4_HOLOL|nr:ras-associating domain containing protein [Holotrichia oblita]
MMWVDEQQRRTNNLLGDEDDDSDVDSDSSGEELPIWVRGEQRWVSGVVGETTCQDIITVLLQDEEVRVRRHVAGAEQYHITERWRGVEQPLDPNSSILDIWNAWGRAQPEVKISLRRIKNDHAITLSRRSRYRSDSSTWSDRSAWKTIHPKRLNALQNEKQPSSTEELLKLVLAQGEVIRRQLRKLRHSEHQIGFLEDKTHRVRTRKHGSNFLLETYLKGLSEAVDPENDLEQIIADKNSDSGVVTEGDSEQCNHNKPGCSTESPLERFSPSSEEFHKDLKDDDTNSTVSEATIKEQLELFEMINKINKKLLKEEECLVRLHANIKKYDKTKSATEETTKALGNIRKEMAKGTCEMQHNEVVLEETKEMLDNRKLFLESLHKDLLNEDREFEMLQALLYSQSLNGNRKGKKYSPYKAHFTKELLDTLV